MAGAQAPKSDSAAALGQFLQAQATAAGLSARQIAQRFEERVGQEAGARTKATGPEGAPTNGMRFSKSHLDRLFKGQARLPTKEFIRAFLEVTSLAAGISRDRHKQLAMRAEALLAEAQRANRSEISRNRPSVAANPIEQSVATLQIQLELERTLHLESKLRWALNDAQFLITTLLQMVSALRNIIQDIDTAKIRGLHNEGNLRGNQRKEAFSQKEAAESQLSLANERRMLLENLWDQAHANINRLSSHPDVAHIPPLPDAPIFPQQPLLDVHTQSTLTDIATALDRVQEVNELNGRQAREWQQELTRSDKFDQNEEMRVLIACTRLADSETRRTALRALIRGWPEGIETRDTLVRMTDDENSDIQELAITSLIELWPEDSESLLTLVRAAARERPIIQLLAISGLAKNWRGNRVARDALVDLTQNGSRFSREIAAQGLGVGWPGDTVARDTLLQLALDEHTWLTALEGLHDGWADDVRLRRTLVKLSRSSDAGVRRTTAGMLGKGWLGDSEVTAALSSLLRDQAPAVRWFAERSLANHGVTTRLDRPVLDKAETASGPALLAARVPQEFASRHALKLIDELHRGIHFDAPITAVLGDNATGKTVLLDTLAKNLGIAVGRANGHYARTTPLRLRLADQIELLWRNKPKPEECLYVKPTFERASMEEVYGNLEAWVRQYRLILVDDFPTAFTMKQHDKLFARARGMALHNGCQLVVATTHGRHMIPEGVNIVHLGQFRRRLLL